VRVGRRNHLIGQALPVNHQIRLRDQVQPHRSHALTILLESLQRDAALRAVDLTATARVESGMVRAEFTLRR